MDGSIWISLLFLLIGGALSGLASWFIAKAKFGNETAAYKEKSTGLQSELQTIKNDLHSSSEENKDLIGSLSSLRAVNENLELRLTEQKAEVEEMQKKFQTEFENIANKILDEKSQKFTEQNKTNMNTILEPLGKKIKEFEEKVEKTNKDGIERTTALREHLDNLQKMNKQMSEDAQNLVKALKGDSKTQGNWGELQLEKVLERSGLKKGIEYSVQESFTTDEGNRRFPDVIINLPDSKKIIIDSKVSLTHYERMVNADQDDQMLIHRKAFVDGVKKHVKDLSLKEYHNLYSTESPDFVLMFIPIEPAFSAAIQYGDSLFENAYDKNIIIVSPTTLLATLRTIANIWKQEYQNRYVLEIAEEAGKMYDKLVGFTEDMIKIGKQLDQSKGTYEDAMKKFSTGSGNLIRRADKIKELGAKASKKLPESIVERSKEEQEQKQVQEQDQVQGQMQELELGGDD